MSTVQAGFIGVTLVVALLAAVILVNTYDLNPLKRKPTYEVAFLDCPPNVALKINGKDAGRTDGSTPFIVKLDSLPAKVSVKAVFGVIKTFGLGIWTLDDTASSPTLNPTKKGVIATFSCHGNTIEYVKVAK